MLPTAIVDCVYTIVTVNVVSELLKKHRQTKNMPRKMYHSRGSPLLLLVFLLLFFNCLLVLLQLILLIMSPFLIL